METEKFNEAFAEMGNQIQEALSKCLCQNELVSEEDYDKYMEYDRNNRGCTLENPFVIDDDGDLYTLLEYRMLDNIFYYGVIRLNYKLKTQELVEKDGRYYDCLTVIAYFLDDITNEECYWFDVTKGFLRGR